MSDNEKRPQKNLFIKTWGCQMNVYDSDRMVDVLAPLGYKPVDAADDADLVILNTCHIREKATEKVFSDLGRLRELKNKRQDATGKTMRLAVAGCVAQAEGAEITRRAPYVDMVFGPQTYHQLPDMIAAVEKSSGQTRIVNTDFPIDSKFDHLPQDHSNTGASAYLSIQEGCDKFCSFCVVPYTRGAEYSRDAAPLLDEARRLVANGAKEIILLGQNVNAWHGAGPNGLTWGLDRLLYALAEIDGIERLRYMTSHPRDMNKGLIQAHGKIPQLMPFLHLPVQHGSDRMLEQMNRKHGRDLYFQIIDDLRTLRPDMAFSSDFIVGFPGETDQDFKDMLNLVERVEFSSCYSFKYSPRAGTPAAGNPVQVNEKIKDERLQMLQSLLFAQSHAFNHTKIGQALPVLLDRKGRQDGQLHGRSPWNQSVHVDAPERVMGQIVDVLILGASQNSINGRIVLNDAPLHLKDSNSMEIAA